MPQQRNYNAPNSRAYRNTTGVRRIVVLPAEGCQMPAPRIPEAVKDHWQNRQKRRWKELWSSPQATQWDESCSGTVALLVEYEDKLLNGQGSAWMGQEVRHASEQLGLTPRSMAALGWIIGTKETEQQ